MSPTTSYTTSPTSWGESLECWILYDRPDLEVNRFFADRLAEHGTDLGMDCRIVTTDSMDGCPDTVVSRMRDHRISEMLERRGAKVFNDSRVCRICNDKLETYRFAESLGIPVLSYGLPDGSIPEGPPWVVKSRSGHGGTQVKLAKDERELGSAVESMPDPLVQRMARTPGRDLRVYVLDGEVLAGVMRSSDTDFRANHGLGGKAELCDVPETCLDIVEKVVSGLRPTLVGVDFVFDDGVPLLNEVEDVVGTRMLYELTDLDPARLLMESVQSNSSL